MLQYDLSKTALMSDQRGKIPCESMMLAVTAALLVIEGVACSDIVEQPVELTEHNVGQVSQFIKMKLAPFMRDIGHDSQLQDALGQLIGLRVWSS